MKKPDHERNLRSVWLVLPVFVFAAGCSTTTAPTPARPTAHIEVLEEVGFTITEDVNVGSDVRQGYDEALRFLRQGQLDQGVVRLQSISENAPELAAPQIDLGIAHHLTGDLEAAEKHLLLALEINPDHPMAHNELGIVYRKTGRFAKARQSYEAALTIYPGYHYARRNLAILCDLYLVDLECALENYEAYMATVPGDEEAEIWIADLRYRIGQ